MTSDEEWMIQYRDGSEKAFNFLYEKYSTLVWSYLQKKMRSSHAEDMYQKVWRHLHEKRHHYNNQPFAPWFFVLIRNLLIDEYRSLGRLNSREVSDGLTHEITSEEEKLDVEDLLNKLPDDTQNLIKKYYLEGLDYEELELQTGLSQTTLRQRLSRGIRSLRKIYEK